MSNHQSPRSLHYPTSRWRATAATQAWRLRSRRGFVAFYGGRSSATVGLGTVGIGPDHKIR